MLVTGHFLVCRHMEINIRNVARSGGLSSNILKTKRSMLVKRTPDVVGVNSTDLLTRVHYNDVIMGAIAPQITSLTIVYSIVYSDADQRRHQSSASMAFVRGIHRGPVNSPHKWPVTRKMFPFDDVIIGFRELLIWSTQPGPWWSYLTSTRQTSNSKT